MRNRPGSMAGDGDDEKMKRLAMGALALVLTAACAGVGTYPTTVAIGQSAAIFGQIGPLAAAEGHKMLSGDRNLEVEFDASTRILYQADPEMTHGPNIVIGVAVTNDSLPPAEVEAKMQAASKKAYEWLEKAQAGLASAPAVVATPAVSMNVNIDAKVTAPAVGLSAGCNRLVACHAALASMFCQAGGTECQFKIEVSGMDDEACNESLAEMPVMVQPLSMTMPGFSMPAACQ